MAFIDEQGILYVDNSTLGTLAQCQSKAMMRYGYSLVPDGYINAPADAGTALHKGVEVLYRTGDPEQALAAFDAKYKEWALMNIDSNDRLGYPNVRLVMESWLARNTLESLPYVVEPAHCELSFKLPLTDGIYYSGHIDALVRPKGGGPLYVLDTKSTGRLDRKFLAQFKMSTQMSGYAWAAQQLTGEPIAGVYINCVDVSVVPNGTRKCRTHGVLPQECGHLHPKHQVHGPTTRSPLQLTYWKNDAMRLCAQWRRMLALEYEGGLAEAFDVGALDPKNIIAFPMDGAFAYQVCTLCDYRFFCEAGKPTTTINNMFNVLPWYPGSVGDPNA